MPYRHTTYAGLAATERPGTDPEAPAFVFLNGLTFDRRMWEPVLAELAAAHRAIALDLPGHGGSPPFARRGLAAVVDAGHAAVAAAGVPYLCLLANEPAEADVAWLQERVPQAGVVVWPVEHHFPHLARPALFADVLGELVRRAAVAG